MKKDNKLPITKKMIEDLEKDMEIDIEDTKKYIHEIEDMLSVSTSSISPYTSNNINSFSYVNMYPQYISYDAINPYKDRYNILLNTLSSIKDRRENKITQISLENIKNIIEIKHIQSSLEYNTNFLNDVFENNSESIDIFDIPDVEISTINKKCSSMLIDISIYRKFKKLDYSFVIDVVNNKLYIMFDDEKDLAKFKIQYSGV